LQRLSIATSCFAVAVQAPACNTIQTPGILPAAYNSILFMNSDEFRVNLATAIAWRRARLINAGFQIKVHLAPGNSIQAEVKP
jgi:hypothetical protein